MLAPGAAGRIAPALAGLAASIAAVLFTGVPWRWVALGVVAVLAGVTVFLFVFFRDPERTAGAGVVSAADGTVRAVERTDDRWTISVFLGVTDVHVNRLPLAATIEEVGDAGDGHRPAYRPDAGANARRTYRLRTEIGPVEVVQITGIAARRLVSFVRAGWAGAKGERFGMIVLGSRVDVHLPAGRVEPVVAVGDRVRAGASTIARVRP